MSDERKNQLIISFLDKHTGGDFMNQSPRHLYAKDALEALWQINATFGNQVSALKAIKYNPELEPEADKAIEHFVMTGNWLASINVKRIIFERHSQAIIYLSIAERVDSFKVCLSVPVNLPRSVLPPFVVLQLLHGMELPYPIAE